jgi:Holliday junction resolvasome RuvABC endonuclease subunit
MHILGVDPGTRTVAFAQIGDDLLEFDTVTFESNDLEDKILELSEGMYEKLYFSPVEATQVAIESFSAFGWSGAITKAVEMGEILRFLVEELHRRYNIPRENFFRYSSHDVRDFICGNRRAKDSQIKECLSNMGYTQRMNAHTRDALSVALYHKEYTYGK